MAAMSASPAAACIVTMVGAWGPAEFRKYAEDSVQSAAAIIDGEVVRPMSGQQNAIVRAAKVHKGPNQTEFEIGAMGSCHVSLPKQGERYRLLLFGGPDIYYAGYVTGAQYIDEVLGSDRRKDWPPVAPPAP